MTFKRNFLIAFTGFAAGLLLAHVALGLRPEASTHRAGVSTVEKAVTGDEADPSIARPDDNLRPGSVPVEKGASNSDASELTTKGKTLYELEHRRMTGRVRPDEFGRLVGLYDELGEDDLASLRQLYKQQAQAGRFDLAALRLLFHSGGQQVVDLIKEQLGPGAMVDEMGVNFKKAVGGILEGSYAIRSLPMDEDLIHMARDFATSTFKEDRAAAAGLLAHWKSDEAARILENMLLLDAETDVRVAAIRALGTLNPPGAESTLSRLERDIGGGSRERYVGPGRSDPLLAALQFSLERIRLAKLPGIK